VPSEQLALPVAKVETAAPEIGVAGSGAIFRFRASFFQNGHFVQAHVFDFDVILARIRQLAQRS